MPAQARDYALVVGVNDYPKYGSGGRPLRGAIRDAEAVAAWLTDETWGGGLPAGNCHLVRSSVDSSGLTLPQKHVIDREMEQIWEDSKEGGARRFYFYFSGHGQTASHDDVALCMANWARNRPTAALSFRQYLNFVVKCTNFEEIIVLMDCCRSRKITAKGQQSELGCPLPEPGERRVFVAHATEFQTPAHEAATGALAEDDEPIVRGHFTRALIAGLNGQAATPAGGASASSLAQYLEKVVPRIAKRHGHEQSPVFEQRGYAIGGSTEPVLGAAAKIETVDVRIAFSTARVGPVRLEGPTAEIVREGPVSTAPWDETLQAATHRLTDTANGDEMDLRLQQATGAIDVDF